MAWSHPKFGIYLSSVGYDKKVKIFKEKNKNKWNKDYIFLEHTNSVNSCEFSPIEYGLILLCASTDGNISIHEKKKDKWLNQKIVSHLMGVNCLSFGPPFISSSIRENNSDENNINNNTNNNNNNNVNNGNFNKIDNTINKNNTPLRFVTGGCDNLIKIWTNNPNQNSLVTKKINSQLNFDKKIKKILYKFNITPLEGHSNWIRGVDWLKSIGSLSETIASCSEDETVKIWRKISDNWEKYELNKIFGYPTWNVKWSHLGTFLAVSAGDNCVYLFKENYDGNWEEYSKMKQEQNIVSKHRNNE